MRHLTSAMYKSSVEELDHSVSAPRVFIKQVPPEGNGTMAQWSGMQSRGSRFGTGYIQKG